MYVLKQFLKAPQLLNRTAFQVDYQSKVVGGFTEAQQAEVFELVKQAHVILLDSTLCQKVDIRRGSEDREWMLERGLAPPFKVCWIEILSGGKLDTANVCFYKTVNTKGERPFLTAAIGMLVHEKEPGLYDIFVQEIAIKKFRWIGSDGIVHENEFYGDAAGASAATGHLEVDHGSLGMNISVFRNVTAEYQEEQDITAVGTLRVWLMAMEAKHAALGVEETEEFIQVPRENRPYRTRSHQVRQVIRIVHKSQRDKVRPVTATGKVVDFSHRWECRGHWRRFLLEDGGLDLGRYGKDRQGDYCVPGRTWVSETVKGPEGKPLIRKTRMVVAGKEPKESVS